MTFQKRQVDSTPWGWDHLEARVWALMLIVSWDLSHPASQSRIQGSFVDLCTWASLTMSLGMREQEHPEEMLSRSIPEEEREVHDVYCRQQKDQWVPEFRGEGGIKRASPGGSEGEESACSVGNLALIPGSGRFPGEENGNPFQCSCLENPMDRGVWLAKVHRIAKSQTGLKRLSMHAMQRLKRQNTEDFQGSETTLYDIKIVDTCHHKSVETYSI